MRSTLAAILLALLLVTSLALPFVGAPNSPDGQGGTDKPDHPEKPDHPDKPDHPGKPDQPDNPGKPENPGNPENPGKPEENTDNPDHPGAPDHPDQSGYSDKPGRSDDPVNPDNPEKTQNEPDHPESSDNDQRTPDEILTEAEQLLALARQANAAKRYSQAAELAGKAEKLALLAQKKLLSAQGVLTRQEVQEDIELADHLNVLAAANLSAAESVDDRSTVSVDTSSLKSQFQSAKQLLDMAWKKLEEGDYAGAKALAIQARIRLRSVGVEAALVAEKAKSLLDELKKIEDSSLGVKGKIVISSDNSSKTVVQAEGHSVTFNASSPKLTYTMFDSNDRGGFEANVFGLVEFDDKDGDNEVDEGEVVRVLQFDSLDWTTRPQIFTARETAVEVWYRSQSPEYDVWILMSTLDTPVIKYFSSGKDAVVYFVDGNARDTKLDLVVNRWPWSSQADKLALRVFVTPNERGNIETRRVGVDEEWIVVSSGESTVRIKVVEKAEAQHPDDLSMSVVDVKMSYEIDRSGTILVDLVYPNFGDNIFYHDPEFGIGGMLAYIPVLSLHIVALILGILAVVLLAMRRPLQGLRIRSL